MLTNNGWPTREISFPDALDGDEQEHTYRCWRQNKETGHWRWAWVTKDQMDEDELEEIER